MPDWLSDPSSTTYLLLATVAAGVAFYWYRTQTRQSARIAAGVIGVVGAWLAAAWVLESPREEAVRRVGEMVAAANEFQPARISPHVSERFQYRGETKKSFEAAHTWDLARQHAVRVAVWDFDRAYVERPDPDTLSIGFMLKVDGEAHGHPFQGGFYVKAPFVRDPDGAWRLQSFTLYADPLKKANGDVFILPGTN
jgi:hypothetical protein